MIQNHRYSTSYAVPSVWGALVSTKAVESVHKPRLRRRLQLLLLQLKKDLTPTTTPTPKIYKQSDSDSKN